MATNSNKGKFNGATPSRYVGANTFENEKPVCLPVAPGRSIKPLSGPVHAGFPKAGSSYQRPPSKLGSTPHVGSHLQVSEQTYDLYNNPRRKKAAGKNNRTGKRR